MNGTKFCDFHLHSNFSGDCDSPMEEMIAAGIQKGLPVMCFTEHLDMDFPEEYPFDFNLDVSDYQQALLQYQERFSQDIDVRFGIELGIQEHLGDRLAKLIAAYPFDFIIGSSHLIRGLDPYYPPYWEGRTRQKALLESFETTLRYLHAFSDIDVYGHMDYVIRYAPDKSKGYEYQDFQDILDEILRTLIQKGIGIELNTGGYKYGLDVPNPCGAVLNRYRELGGEILTLGSDAHTPEAIGYGFSHACTLLKSLGYTHYTIFQNRKPQFLPLP